MADHYRHQRKAESLRKQAGMTLIELLIAVAIVGILAAIAIPSYQTYIAQSKRAEAKGVLLATAQFLERYYTTNSRYDQTQAGVAVALPYAQSPEDTNSAANYAITADYTSGGTCTLGQCYTLSATPTGSMSGDSCGTLTLTNTGVQGAAGTVADCWQH